MRNRFSNFASIAIVATTATTNIAITTDATATFVFAAFNTINRFDATLLQLQRQMVVVMVMMAYSPISVQTGRERKGYVTWLRFNKLVYTCLGL